MTSPRARRGDAEPRAEPGAAQEPPAAPSSHPAAGHGIFSFPVLLAQGWSRSGVLQRQRCGFSPLLLLCFSSFLQFFFFPFCFFWGGFPHNRLLPRRRVLEQGQVSPKELLGTWWPPRSSRCGPLVVSLAESRARSPLVAPTALFSRKGAARIGTDTNHQDDAGEVGWTLLCAVVATSPPRVAKAHMAAHTPEGRDSPLARCLLRNITFYLVILDMQTSFARVLSLPSSSSRS